MLGVGTNHIIEGGNKLGLRFAEKGNGCRQCQVLYDREYSAFSELKTGVIDWGEIFKDTSWLHWLGISPAVSLNIAQVCLEALKVVNDINITVSVDLNYRKKLWNYGKSPVELMPELVEKCDIIFGDPFTAQTMLGIDPGKKLTGEWSLSKLENYRDAINRLFPKVKAIAHTMRSMTNSSNQSITGYL